MSFWERLNKLDRRYIYLFIGIGTIIPIIYRLKLPIFVTKPTEQVYKIIDKTPSNSPENAIIISFDFDPSVTPELMPMGVALLKHCFAKNINVICMSLYPQGIGLAAQAIEIAKEEFPNVKYGEDYILLSWAPGSGIVIMSMGEDIKQTFKVDYQKKPLDSFPIMSKIKNYSQINNVTCLTGSSIYMSWIFYANVRYNQTITVGITGVMAPEVYPWLQSKQVAGMLGGLRGAAEYETLLMKNNLIKKEGTATVGMDPQSIVHIIIMIFIIIANIGYFMTKKKR